LEEEVEGVEASGMVATIIIRLGSFALAKYACKKGCMPGKRT
jgi:hypothetical protein